MCGRKGGLLALMTGAMPVGATQRSTLPPFLFTRFPQCLKATTERNDLATTQKHGLSGIACTMHSTMQLMTPIPVFPLATTAGS